MIGNMFNALLLKRIADGPKGEAAAGAITARVEPGFLGRDGKFVTVQPQRGPHVVMPPPQPQTSSDEPPAGLGASVLRKIRVVCRENQVGLSRDLRILTDILRSLGVEGDIARPVGEMSGGERFAMNVFVESLWPPFLDAAAVNCMLPHPEWFNAEWKQHLPKLHILAKTRDAEKIFSLLGAKTTYVGWTSADRFSPRTPRYRAFLHLAGKSSYKGTGAVYEAWKRHPEWPPLVIVAHPALDIEARDQNNVYVVRKYLEDDDLLQLQNECCFHICPSVYEGFGHYIMEGLSCGAVVLTTGAPPMSELVDERHGILVPYDSVRVVMLAQGKEVAPHGVESALQRALGMHEPELTQRRILARKAFEANDTAFKARFKEVLYGILDLAATAPFLKASPKQAVPLERLPDVAARTFVPGVLLEAVFQGWSGYAKAAREIGLRLANHIYVQGMHALRPEGSHAPSEMRVSALEKVQVGRACPWLRFFGPDAQRLPEGRFRINYTMMETQVIHPDMVAQINRKFHELWTPTRWNAEVFRRSGVAIPVRTFPLGVDSVVYRSIPGAKLPKCRLLSTDQAGRAEVPEGFLFISVGLPSFRKGFDLLSEAFEKAFANDPDCALICAITHSPADMAGLEQCRAMKARVYALEGEYDEHGMARIYSACDAYITASRGEGWNLPLCEAAACGLPVVCGDNTAHMEVTGGDAFTFRSEGTAAVPGAERISMWYKDVPFTVFGKKSLAELIELMRLVRSGGRAVHDKVVRLRQRMLREWTWERAAALIAARLLELNE